MLQQTAIPPDFDLLSIDIDGNDYHVWKALTGYQPRVVCIEFNPTIPTEVDFVQLANPAVTQGSSLRALVALGKELGYELVAVLQYNAFFVRCEYYPLFGLTDNGPETLRQDTSAITYIFSGYDGTVFLRGFKRLVWHRVGLSERMMQPLPSLLRTYPDNYRWWQRVLFSFFTRSRRFSRYMIRRFRMSRGD